MNTFLEILNPSFLLFPALLGSSVLGLVCPLVGAYLILRRTVFLGLTLPQIAGAGVAFAFWLQYVGLLSTLRGGERSVGMLGSLLFTFLGMGFLGYLEHRGKGLAEGRLAAAYSLAGALTILFIVFNPAGEVEILSLLKGEVIALSGAETKILFGVFGSVLTGMLLFRREFLLASFDRDLAFLLKGGVLFWDVMLYLLAGLSIAIGVIMAGPLLIFGFLVLPPLAARPLARGMTSFLSLSCLLGVLMAFFGFYLSVRLDLPLGPTDVALGCAMLFASHALRKVRLRMGTTVGILCLASACISAGCSSTTSVTPLSAAPGIEESAVWIAKVRNSTNSELRLPGGNPLRSLAEMAGKVSSDYRPTVMDLLRESLQSELVHRKVKIAFPESVDARMGAFSHNPSGAAHTAREGKLAGLLLITDIQRWHADGRLLSTRVDFKLLRISDGSVVWEKDVRRVIATTGVGHVGQASADAVKEIMRELFGA